MRAAQEERTASASGSIVVPIPAAGTDAGAETGGNRDSAREDEGSAGDGSRTGEVRISRWRWSFRSLGRRTGRRLFYVTYELNDSEILAHRPVETWGSGKHILSLYYPIDNLVPNITNTFNVYLRMENGTGEIGTGGCIASISGQGMAAAAAWDGTVTVEEYVSRLAFGGGLGMKGFAGEMGIETMELVRKSYADSIGKALIGAFGKPIDLA